MEGEQFGGMKEREGDRGREGEERDGGGRKIMTGGQKRIEIEKKERDGGEYKEK